jgi:DNA-binding LytR/AlgR family response regulator
MLFFPAHSKNIRVCPEEIIYADTCKSCTTVYLANHKRLTGICSLTDLHKRLSGKGFLRIHKGYLVNMRYITGFYGNVLILDGNLEFPIGRDYRREVKAHIDLAGSKSRLYT